MNIIVAKPISDKDLYNHIEYALPLNDYESYLTNKANNVIYDFKKYIESNNMIFINYINKLDSTISDIFTIFVNKVYMAKFDIKNRVVLLISLNKQNNNKISINMVLEYTIKIE